MSERAAWDMRSAAIGRAAEKRFHEYLDKSQVQHIWQNARKESKKIDFIILLGENQVGLDCEHKDIYYVRKYYDEGLDFIANKCDNYPSDFWYVLEYDIGYVAQQMDVLLKFGIREWKWTKRGKKEEFIRIPGSLLYRVEYKDRIKPNFIYPTNPIIASYNQMKGEQ